MPVKINIEIENLAEYIDHTLLKPEATFDDVKKLCQEAERFEFASVCVNPVFIKTCSELLANSRVKICAVVGFPLGANTTEMKAMETENAVKNGAQEIDMVIPVGMLKAKNYEYVENDIRAVVLAAGDNVKVKVIIETCLLTDQEKKSACEIAKKAGAGFVKTSTGFNKAGASVEDVVLMRSIVGEEMGVKAAGGIRDTQTAIKMIKAGANRIGASASVKIVEDNC